MIYRRNVWLAALVLALALLELGLDDGGPARRAVGRLFPDLYADRAARIELVQGDGRLELARDPSGAGWTLPGSFGHPAFAPTVENFLSGMTGLTSLDLLSDRPEAHREYGVGPEGIVVRIHDADGRLLAALVQGAPLGRESGSYVRREGENEVYRARSMRALSLEPTGWLDARLLSFAEALVSSIRAAGGALGAPLERTRDERPDRWLRPDGSRASVEAVRGALRDLAGRFFVDRVVAARTEDLDFGEPRLVLELGLVDGGSVRLHVGRDASAAEGGGVLVARELGGFVLSLPRVSYEALLGVLEHLARS